MDGVLIDHPLITVNSHPSSLICMIQFELVALINIIHTTRRRTIVESHVWGRNLSTLCSGAAGTKAFQPYYLAHHLLSMIGTR